MARWPNPHTGDNRSAQLRRWEAGAGAPVLRKRSGPPRDHPEKSQECPFLARRMKRAESVLVPGAGHALPNEAPEKFNAVLLAFLVRHSAG